MIEANAPAVAISHEVKYPSCLNGCGRPAGEAGLPGSRQPSLTRSGLASCAESLELIRSTHLGSLAAAARTAVPLSSVVARAAAKSDPPIAARARRSRGAVTRLRSFVRSRVNTRSNQPFTFGTAARGARSSAARTLTAGAGRKVRPASRIVSPYERARTERARAASILPPPCHSRPRCGSCAPFPLPTVAACRTASPLAPLQWVVGKHLLRDERRVPPGRQAAAAIRPAESR